MGGRFMINTYRCRKLVLEDLLRFKCDPLQEHVYKAVISNISSTKYMLDNSFVVEDSKNNELIAIVDSYRITHFLAAVGVLFSVYFLENIRSEIRGALKIIRKILDSIQEQYNCSVITTVNEGNKSHVRFAKHLGFIKSDIDGVSDLCYNSKIYYRNLDKCH